MAYKTLHDRLRGPIAQTLAKELKIGNPNAVPQVEKVVINVGINKTKMDSKEMHAYIAESLMQITGQQPVFTKTRKAISNFKTREGMVVGAVVTLRGKHMEEFLDRLLSYALPRIRDFRGLSPKLDGHGNYALGIRDHSIFPEVPPVDARQIFGMQIQLQTTAEDDKTGFALLKQIGMPFRPEKKEEETKNEIPQDQLEQIEKLEEENKEKKEDTSVDSEAPEQDTNSSDSK